MFARHRKSPSMRRTAGASGPGPVLHALMLPLSLMVLVLIGGSALLAWRLQQHRLAAVIRREISEVPRSLRHLLDQQAAGLSAALQVITADPELQRSLARGDILELRDKWMPVFERLRDETGITHFYFSDPERVCLLRLHNPDLSGDRFERYTALQAEHTGITSVGMELGPLGILTLRAVQPVTDGDRLLGYVELGREIEHVLRMLHERDGLDLIVKLRKEVLDRRAWENGMRLLGREPDWDQFPANVLAYSSLDTLPQALTGVPSDYSPASHVGPDELVANDGRPLRVMSAPLTDVAGRVVGDLLVLRDVQAEKAYFAAQIRRGMLFAGLLLGLLLAYVFFCLRDTDQSISRRLQFQRIVAEISAALLRTPAGGFDLILDGVLHDIGRLFAVDRCYIFRVSDDGALLDNTHEWCAPGVASALALNRNLAVESFSWWMERMRQGRPVVLDDVKALPREADALKNILLAQSVRSLVCVPWLPEGRLTGFIGFDMVDRPVKWKPETVELLTLVAELTGSAMLKQRMEQDLRRSEERLQLATRGTHIGIWDYDITHDRLVWDEMMFRVFGVDPAAFGGKFDDWARCVLPSALPAVEADFRAALRGEKDFNVEFPIRRADGELRYLAGSAAVVRDTDGRPVRIVGVNYDITERKRAAEEIARARDEWERTFDAVPDLLCLFGNDFRLRAVNRAMAEKFGLPPAQLVGRYCYQYVHGTDAPPPFCPHARTVEDGRTHTAEVHSAALGGDFLVTTTPLFDREGVLTGVVHVARDITERKRREQEVLRAMQALEQANTALEQSAARANQMAAQAEAANMAKSWFLANMSHEIRTPLNGVIGMTGLLLDTDLNEKQRRYADIIRASGETLLSLINDILDFSRIEAGKVRLESLPFDLEEELEAFTDALASQAQVKGLDFVCRVMPGTPTWLVGDPGRIRQILTNLAGNAVKFTERGSVTVTVANVADGASADMHGSKTEANDIDRQPSEDMASPPAPAADVRLRFEVTDTGIGIPADKQSELFAPFTQVDGSTTRKYGGTGLGLAISRKLTEMMDGAIGLHSTENRGSTFWFTVRVGVQSVDRAPSLPGLQRLRNYRDTRILIVDDNAVNRELLATLLRNWELRVQSAASAQEALAVLRDGFKNNDPCRVAILDMLMPDMDGEELAGRISADQQVAPVRLILMTSLGRQPDPEKLPALGFAAVLSKPLHRADVIRALLTALDDEMTAESGDADPTTTDTVARAKLRVLVAEDNVVNQQVARGLLEKLGCRVDCVPDGAGAVAALATVDFDMVLMDVQMPGMDGYEATRRIRDPQSNVKNHAVPIIAMTAHAMKGDRDKCLSAGMNDYLAKPVRSDELRDKLAHWLNPALLSAPPAVAVDDTTPDTPMVWNREDLLNRVMGDAALATHLINLFIQDVPRRLAEAASATAAGDHEQARRQLHTIKGVAANLGAEVLLRAAEMLENLAEARRMERVKAGLPDLERHYRQAAAAMQQPEA